MSNKATREAIRWLVVIAALSAFFAVWAALRPPPLSSARAEITLPDDYRDGLVHYATVGRSDFRSRDIWITEAAAEIAGLNTTATMPDGTRIVIEEYPVDRTGSIIRGGGPLSVHMAEKRSDWSAAAYEDDHRAGEWNFFAFTPNSGQQTGEVVRPCFTCHLSAPDKDFLYSKDLLEAFSITGEVQQGFCNRPDRFPCN